MLCWSEVASAECLADKFVLTKMVSCSIRATCEKVWELSAGNSFFASYYRKKVNFSLHNFDNFYDNIFISDGRKGDDTHDNKNR